MMNRRDFLNKAFKFGGISTLIGLGLSYNDAKCFAGAAMQSGGVESGSSCDTDYYTNTGAATLDLDIKDAETSTFVGGVYVHGTQKSLCAVTFYLTAKDGAAITANDYHIEVWTVQNASLSAPGDLVAQQGSDSNAVTGVGTWADTAVKFTFSSSITLSASTYYAFVITHNNPPSATTEAELECDGASTTSGRIQCDSSGGTVISALGGPRMVLHE